MKDFTDREVELMVNGILRLMKDVVDAEKMLNNGTFEITKSLDDYQKELKDLMDKIMRYNT